MGTYSISAVWKKENGVITHVLLHESDESFIYSGEKKTVAEVVRLINSNNYVDTITWSYRDTAWVVGAKVTVVDPKLGTPYLRTKGDKTVNDNLDNLINLIGFN